MNYEVGQRVTIDFPHGKRIQRMLQEDKDGLYVKYMNQRIAVQPKTNWMGEFFGGYYIGKKPERRTARG